MTDLATIERYALAVPLRVAATVLSTTPVGLRRGLAAGTLSGIKLGPQWFLRRSDALLYAQSRTSDDDVHRFLGRWAGADPVSLPAQLELSEVELLLAERRTMLYRLLVSGALPGVRGRDGWTVPRDALLTALGRSRALDDRPAAVPAHIRPTA